MTKEDKQQAINTLIKQREELAIERAYDYIVDVTDKQTYLMPCSTLYGDGTRFLPLTYKGFEVVYNQIKTMLEGVKV